MLAPFTLCVSILSLFIATWNHLLPLLLLLDLFGLSLLLTSGNAASGQFLLFIVLLVFSSVLGIVLLITTIRNGGSDNTATFF